MSSIRALRRSHGLTLIDLALLTDIPARTLAEIEYGLQRLDYESRARLARFFGVPPELLRAGAPRHRAAAAAPSALGPTAPLVLATLAGAALLATPSLADRLGPTLASPYGAVATAAPAQAARTALPRARARALAASAATAAPTSTATPRPTATAAPPTPTPRFTLAAGGPHGCPIAPASGRVVLTQGYGVGSHAPSAAWGAVDLAIDGDGDGNAEPDTTRGVPVLSALSGVARVYMGSWPGGNFVRVVDERSGWSVAYGHLDSVAVADGQAVALAAPIGTVGSTGMASGPHLHYEVWHGDTNVDPTNLIECF